MPNETDWYDVDGEWLIGIEVSGSTMIMLRTDAARKLCDALRHTLEQGMPPLQDNERE